MNDIEKRLRAQGKTQKEIGESLGIGQSRVSDLMKQKADLFSLDMLVKLADKVGLPVTVTIAAPGAGVVPVQEKVSRRFAAYGVRELTTTGRSFERSAVYQGSYSTNAPTVFVAGIDAVRSTVGTKGRNVRALVRSEDAVQKLPAYLVRQVAMDASKNHGRA